MKNEEVIELIHQNGVGQNIQCFFTSKIDGKDKGNKSLISNYKYQKGLIKIYIEKDQFREHEKNLAKHPYCELFIKQEFKSYVFEVKLFCKFFKVENQFIYIKVFNIKYFDDQGKEVSQRFSLND